MSCLGIPLTHSHTRNVRDAEDQRVCGRINMLASHVAQSSLHSVIANAPLCLFAVNLLKARLFCVASSTDKARCCTPVTKDSVAPLLQRPMAHLGCSELARPTDYPICLWNCPTGGNNIVSGKMKANFATHP